MRQRQRNVSARRALAWIFMLVLVMAPFSSRAATTYDFQTDTVGATPSGVTVTAGTFDVQDEAPLGKSMRAVTQTGVIAGVLFSDFASSSDQSVVWKQAYSDPMGRSGFTLRAQNADTNVINSVGAKQGYLFHVYDSGSVYIWRVGSSAYTALWSGSLSKAEPRWFKALAVGTSLGFYYSDDGTNYTRLASTTDATYASGKVQYTAGYGSSVSRDYVDDIVITNLDFDGTAPTIQSFSPADNATGVSPSANLVMTFTESVDAESGSISIYKASDDSLVETIDVTSGQVTGTGTNTITINPAVTLTSSTGYYVTVAATAFDDPSSNSFAGITASSTWNFTVADVGTPALVSVSPLDGAVDVSMSTDLVLTFDEAVDAESGAITIKKASDDSAVEEIDVTSGQVTGSGTTVVTVTPSTDLLPGTSYYVQIATTAFDDASGNSYAGISDATSWNFTTLADAETVIDEQPRKKRTTSVGSRIQNLLRIGNVERARQLMQEYPGAYRGSIIPASVVPEDMATALPDVSMDWAVRDLERGFAGADVIALQQLLMRLGYEIPAGATGYFGMQTQSALAAYQARNGIMPSSGYFGALTRAHMKSSGVSPVRIDP